MVIEAWVCGAFLWGRGVRLGEPQIKVQQVVQSETHGEQTATLRGFRRHRGTQEMLCIGEDGEDIMPIGSVYLRQSNRADLATLCVSRKPDRAGVSSHTVSGDGVSFKTVCSIEEVDEMN